jgi:large subunit ribosomal protein L24
MNRIRKGDEVVVVTGKDTGRRGTVIRLVGDGRVVVEGINMAKKHQKPNPTRGVAGGILEIEAPLHLSNVMLWNPATDKPDRIGYKTLEDGRKVRFFKSNNEVLDA